MVPGRDESARFGARSVVIAGLAGWVGRGSAALWLGLCFALAMPEALSAKTPGTVHCYGKWCHRVSTLEEMDGMVGRRGLLKASFYDDCRVDRFNTCNLTSSGEVFRPDLSDNAASPIFPDGTVLLAFNPATQKAAVLRINSAGPYRGDRTLDVSRATAEKLGFREKGVAELMVTVIKSPEPQEARHKKLRRYERVPGFIGAFPSFDAAHTAALASLSLAFEPATAGVSRSGLELAAIEPEPKSDFEIERDERRKRQRAEIARLHRLELGAAQTGLEAVGAVTPSSDTVTSPAPVELGSLPEPLLAGVEADILPTRTLNDDASAVADTDQDLEADQALDLASETTLPTPVAAEARAAPVVAARVGPLTVESVWLRVAIFIDAARAEARRHAAPSALPPLAEWPARLANLASAARAKARAGASRSGPLYRLVAELKLKAQPLRYARD
ncbi:MAG: septal ring lytic transglycosylase RlpA family protein [Hyphomicrobium sp.]